MIDPEGIYLLELFLLLILPLMKIRVREAASFPTVPLKELVSILDFLPAGSASPPTGHHRGELLRIVLV